MATTDQVLVVCAVKERLIRALLESQVPVDGDLRLKTIVQDCVVALDRVPAALFDDSGRRRQLEIDVQKAQAALIRAEARLGTVWAGTQRAHHLELHYDLTPLPNRRHFLAQVHAALTTAAAGCSPPALLYIDLDGFKAVNDTHGHGVGDELLRIVASRLRSAVRAFDVVARLGGDEFACLLVGAPDRERLGRLAGEVHDTVASPLKVGDLELSVCPSIGIATGPIAGITAAALLAHADAAMYLAKRQHSGFAFFDSSGQAPPSLAWPLRLGAVAD